MTSPDQSTAAPPLPGLLRAAGLLVRNRMDRLILADALAGLGFAAHDLSDVPPGKGSWVAVDLLLVDEVSAPAFARAVAEAKRRVEPAFLPALVVVPRLGSAERWLRAGFDDVVRLPIPGEELRGRLRVHLRLRERTLEAERAVFDRLPMGLFRANARGEILTANAAMAALLGFPSVETLAASGPVFEGLELPDAVDAVEDALDGDGLIRGLELPWVRPDGELRWIRWTGNIHGDASGKVLLVEGAAEDVTLRRRIEGELDESRALNGATLDSLGANLAILGPDGRIVSVNAAWREYAGRDDVDPVLRAGLDSHYLEVLRAAADGKEEAVEAAQGIERVLAGAPDPFEMEYPVEVPGEDDAPERRWYRLRANPLRYGGGGSRGAVITLLDVTREHEAREALQLREAALRQAQKMEAVGRLAGGIAHDFNNLLTAIRGNVTLLRDRVSGGDELAEEVAEIDQAADRATALTRQLLVLSRSEVSQVRPVELGALVRSTRRLLRRVIREDIHLDAPDPEVPLHVEADPANLEMVLLNLAVNARDAMPGGGTLSIHTHSERGDRSLPEDHVRAGPHIVIEVRDTGEGIPPEIRGRIFEPFFTTRQASGGSGLGLSIVQGIVEQLGGTVGVESTPGSGTVFRILLPQLDVTTETAPVDRPLAPAAPRTGAGDEEELPRARPGETILLVEDDAQVRRPTRRLLARLGYGVVEAADGAEGLELLTANPGERVDLVLSDVVMPRMTGPEMIRRLKESRETQRWTDPLPRVVFVSGYTEREVDFFRNRSGTTAPRLVQKPFDVGTLARVIRQTLDVGEGSAAAPDAETAPADAIPPADTTARRGRRRTSAFRGG